MSDEQPPDEQGLSKRERQKQRRQRKLEAQRQAARKARVKRTAATFGVLALLLGVLGFYAARWWSQRAAEQEMIAEAAANLEELGCTEVEEQEIVQPSDHLSGDQLAANPPDALYPDRPTTSGRHLGAVAQSGVYDKTVDERVLVHNLEHGYVTIFYSDDADPGQVDELEEFAGEQIEGRYDKVIVSRWDGELPDGANFAYTAWGARQLCEQFDPGVALGFLDDWYGLDGNAPEKSIPAHRGGDTGGIDPNETDGDLLFPPLGEPPAEAEEETEHDGGS